MLSAEQCNIEIESCASKSKKSYPARTCERIKAIAKTTQEMEIRRLGRWACPRLRWNASRIENSSSGSLEMSKLDLALMRICGLNCEFNTEWHSILSGGQAHLPNLRISIP